MSGAYWLERQQDALFNQQLKIGEKQLSRYYLQAYKDTKSYLLDILDKDPEKIIMSDLYRYNKYYDFLEELKANLTNLGEKSIPTIDSMLTQMYKANSKVIDKFTEDFSPLSLKWGIPIDDERVKKAINRIWCADGKNWSERVWDNTGKLSQIVERGITDAVTRGTTKDDLVLTLKESFDIGYRQADRLARTELSYVQNQSTLDRYADMGIEEYEILETIDDKTCETCKKMNGKRFKISESIVGVNMPPFHPNGRGTILPIIKE